MLFNSYEFLFWFLPLTATVFFAICATGLTRAAAAWLALMSLAFYAYWSPRYIVLLLGSIVLNYLAAQWIAHSRTSNARFGPRHVLIAAVSANLLTLAYFKYANFFIDSLRTTSGLNIEFAAVVLPIGISFFTFTQIAFLVDTYQSKVHESGFIPYLLFVTYFPHLIAGPVLHHAEMMPQFARSETYRFRIDNVVSGSTMLAIGLVKKVVLADGIQPFVAPAFDAGPAHALGAIEAWGGALAYALQLYFDFSAYSDMAIGLSRIFNVELPLNFNSPYKARNIVEFWRRWHMTLSRFLRDYLYVPLGGNRLGLARRHLNLMATMLLGGLWHGAGWTFVIWGGLHGLYLVINHAWQALIGRSALWTRLSATRTGTAACVGFTFLVVTVAWVFFRATSLDAALRMLAAMAGANGWALPIEWQGVVIDTVGASAAQWRFADLTAFAGTRQLAWIAVLLTLAWFGPNSQQIMNRLHRLKVAPWLRSPNVAWGAFGALSTFVALLAALNASHGVSEFIYFNF